MKKQKKKPSNRIYGLLAVLVFWGVCGLLNAQLPPLPLTFSYERAKEIALAHQKSCVLIFMDSDSNLDNQNIIHMIMGPIFSSCLKKDVIFIKIDVAGQISEEDKNLKLIEEFHVKAVPSVVLVDFLGHEIAQICLDVTNPEKSAQLIQKTLTQYEDIVSGISDIKNKMLSTEDVKNYYFKARDLGCMYLIDKIIDLGTVIDNSGFFFLEKYVNLVKLGLGDSQDALHLHEIIQKIDSSGAKGYLFRLAIVDFQQADRSHKNAEQTIFPLNQYLQSDLFKGREVFWKVHLMLAQYLYKKGEESLAKKQLESCLYLLPNKEIAGDLKKVMLNFHVEEQKVIR